MALAMALVAVPAVAQSTDATVGQTSALDVPAPPADANLPQVEPVISDGEDRVSQGRNAIRQMADSGAGFDGLFFACDAMALGALEELASLGIAVPDQVGVIGFDGLGSGEFSAPPLTTVQPDFAQAGMTLVDTALAYGEDRPERRVKVHLVERASVR